MPKNKKCFGNSRGSWRKGCDSIPRNCYICSAAEPVSRSKSVRKDKESIQRLRKYSQHVYTCSNLTNHKTNNWLQQRSRINHELIIREVPTSLPTSLLKKHSQYLLYLPTSNEKNLHNQGIPLSTALFFPKKSVTLMLQSLLQVVLHFFWYLNTFFRGIWST